MTDINVDQFRLCLVTIAKGDANGNYTGAQDQPALLLGYLSVTLALSATCYVITHVPTGRAVLILDQLSSAMYAAIELAALDVPWHIDDYEEMQRAWTNEQKRTVSKVIREYRNEVAA